MFESGVAPLDADVLVVMVDVAECILRDYRHGFEMVDDAGPCRDYGYRLYCGGVFQTPGICILNRRNPLIEKCQI